MQYLHTSANALQSRAESGLQSARAGYTITYSQLKLPFPPLLIHVVIFQHPHPIIPSRREPARQTPTATTVKPVMVLNSVFFRA